jgi:thiol-disulfide isomerase/thioredoxin
MSRRRAYRRSVPLLVAGVLAGVPVLAGCGQEQPGTASGDTQFVKGTGQITEVPRGQRRAAPDISGPAVGGGTVRLSDHRGKIVVVNVWGSWCAPCRAEAPHLAKVAKDTKDEGVVFLGINTRDLDKANARAFERSYGVEYPSIYDPSGEQILKFPRGSLSPQTIPSTVVLDREGRIAVRALTELGEKDLRDLLAPLVAEK